MAGNEQTGKYSALLVGATGLVGRALLLELLADPSCEAVTAIARSKRPEAAAAAGAGKLRWVEADMSRLGEVLQSGRVHADRVFCALGTTIRQAGSRPAFRHVDYELPWELGHWAAQNGVKSMTVVTSMGAARRSLFFYSRVKGELEHALSEMAIPRLIVLRPSLLLGERKEKRRVEESAAVLSERLGFLFNGPFRRYKPIKGKDVAAVMRYAADQDGSDLQRMARTGQGAAGVKSRTSVSGGMVITLESDAIAAIAREIQR